MFSLLQHFMFRALKVKNLEFCRDSLKETPIVKPPILVGLIYN